MAKTGASFGVSQTLVAAAALKGQCVALMQAVGMPAGDAEVVADSLVDADLGGVHSHGVIQLPGYLNRLAARGMNPRPLVRVVSESPALAVVDGDGGMGQVASHFAMSLAIRKAAQTGVGAVGVRNSDHFGTCSYWARMAVAHNMIGIATTNGLSCMPAQGGITAVINNNPVGVAAPADQEYPFDLDIATSVAAQGKMKVAAARGERIPLGWALTLEGEPTTDPLEGLRGLALPVAGYKGFGLGLALEVLSAVWTGALFGRQLPMDVADHQPLRIGHFFQAIDVSSMMPADEIKSRMDELARHVHTSRLAPGVDRLFMPGEKEAVLRADRREKGIPITGTVLERLRQSALKLGAEWTLGG